MLLQGYEFVCEMVLGFAQKQVDTHMSTCTFSRTSCFISSLSLYDSVLVSYLVNFNTPNKTFAGLTIWQPGLRRWLFSSLPTWHDLTLETLDNQTQLILALLS